MGDRYTEERENGKKAPPAERTGGADLANLPLVDSKNRLGTAEKDSAAPGLFYFALALQAQYKAIGARISYAISSAYSYQKWYRILSL